MEILLLAPFLFDQSIGYWIGDPDHVALFNALAAVPQHPDVERAITPTGVRLSGPEEAVTEEARLLREAGLEPG